MINILKPYFKSPNIALYQGDNLELMKQLPDNYIDLIYCDVLYNTGRKFEDYDDNLGTPEQAMTWYAPRLEEIYRILKSTGSIYLHMDWRLVHYIKVNMDKIFGFDQFKNHITWKRQPPRGAKATSKQYARITDDILFYTKSNTYSWNNPFEPYDEKYIKERFRPDENGRLFSDCSLGDYSEESINKFEKENKIYITKNGKKRLKRFLDECSGRAISDIWDNINSVNSQAKESVKYDTQKPKELVNRIIMASSNENDIVADFFMGSGTTGEVALELGRRFIGCDIGEKACQISKDRIENISI